MMPESVPYFSICIPVFNGEEFIERAIQSVLDQNFESWSLTVIENCSTDGTWNLLQRRYSMHPRIRLLRNETNIGPRENLNRCLEECRGQWLGILPADDHYFPEALATIHKQTSDYPDAILWIHSHLVYGDGIVPNVCMVYPERRNFRAGDLAEKLYLKGNIFGEISNYFVLGQAFQKNGLRFFDGTQTVDSRFWIRVLLSNPEGRVIYWPGCLVQILQHPESQSNLNRHSGRSYSDLFEEAGDLASLGWNKQILMLQTARILKCWGKFGRYLPQNSRHTPTEALNKLRAAFFHPTHRSIDSNT